MVLISSYILQRNIGTSFFDRFWPSWSIISQNRSGPWSLVSRTIMNGNERTGTSSNGQERSGTIGNIISLKIFEVADNESSIFSLVCVTVKSIFSIFLKNLKLKFFFSKFFRFDLSCSVRKIYLLKKFIQKIIKIHSHSGHPHYSSSKIEFS